MLGPTSLHINGQKESLVTGGANKVYFSFDNIPIYFNDLFNGILDCLEN